MIITGKSRAGHGQLGNYLASTGKNERVQLVEIKGTVAQDPRGALQEMAALAAGTKCGKPLYHAMINPEPPNLLTPEQRREAIDALEAKLGLTGHARVVVMHDKKDRQHIHVVWSRIDRERMCAVSDSHNYRKHEEVSRDLERRFGHNRVQGAHAERDGVERPERTPSRPEWQQQERTSMTGKMVKEEVTAAFRASDGPEAFKAAVEEKGYVIARGDRRDFVIVDRAGGVHSLVRRIEGMKAAELREFMKPLKAETLPTIEEAKGIQFDRAHGITPADERDRWEDKLAASAIEKAKTADEERYRRRAELKKSLSKALLEKSYGRGDDFVTQSEAARKHHKRRQRKNENKNKHELRPTRPTVRPESLVGLGGKKQERGATDEDRERHRQQSEEQSAAKQTTRSMDPGKSGRFDNVEMTDAKRERLERVRGMVEQLDRQRERGDDGPDRQREAPGGGRTRSR